MYIIFYINNTAKGNTSLMLNKLLLLINDIQDENHIIMVCSNYKVLRKRISEMLLLQATIMEKFLQLMTITNQAELYGLMIFIKLILKDYRPSSSL